MEVVGRESKSSHHTFDPKSSSQSIHSGDTNVITDHAGVMELDQLESAMVETSVAPTNAPGSESDSKREESIHENEDESAMSLIRSYSNMSIHDEPEDSNTNLQLPPNWCLKLENPPSFYISHDPSKPFIFTTGSVQKISATVGKAGKKILAVGFEMNIPENALDTEVSIRNALHHYKVKGLNEEWFEDNKDNITLSPILVCGPGGLEFHEDVEVVIQSQYRPASSSSVILQVLEHKGGTLWTRIDETAKPAILEADGKIRFSIRHFCKKKVMAKKEDVAVTVMSRCYYQRPETDRKNVVEVTWQALVDSWAGAALADAAWADVKPPMKVIHQKTHVELLTNDVLFLKLTGSGTSEKPMELAGWNNHSRLPNITETYIEKREKSKWESYRYEGLMERETGIDLEHIYVCKFEMRILPQPKAMTGAASGGNQAFITIAQGPVEHNRKRVEIKRTTGPVYTNDGDVNNMEKTSSDSDKERKRRSESPRSGKSRKRRKYKEKRHKHRRSRERRDDDSPRRHRSDRDEPCTSRNSDRGYSSTSSSREYRRKRDRSSTDRKRTGSSRERGRSSRKRERQHSSSNSYKRKSDFSSESRKSHHKKHKHRSRSPDS